MAVDNPAINILNEIVSGMTGQEVTGLGSIYFFLVFSLLFSIMFVATKFIPMFRNKEEEYKNIRVIIALSVAFLTTISSYALIVEQLQFFGIIAAIALGVSIAILAVIPKDKRKDAATPVMFIGFAAALLIFVTFVLELNWFSTVVNWVTTNYENFFQGEALYAIIFAVITFVIIFIIVVAQVNQAQKRK